MHAVHLRRGLLAAFAVAPDRFVVRVNYCLECEVGHILKAPSRHTFPPASAIRMKVTSGTSAQTSKRALIRA
jgi:hypothetical protein